MTEKNKIRQRIKELEEEYGIEFPTTQKILLSIQGPLVSILDVLYGDVKIFMLEQKMYEADEDVSKKININVGDTVNYREVMVHKNGRPLVYVVSYIPQDRCSDEVIKKLLQEDETTGKILTKREIETIRKIRNITIEKPTPMLSDLFKTNEDMLSREYIMIHKKEIVMWVKETYPLSYFRE